MSQREDPAYPPVYPMQPSAPAYPQQPTYPQQPAAYPQQQTYPQQPTYPGPPGYPSQPPYPQQGNPNTPTGYPQPQGYSTQTYVPHAVYTPQGQVTIKTGAPQHQAMVRSCQVPPNDYLCFSIFVLLFCCLPFGIIGLTKSMNVRSLIAVSDYAAASRVSKSAKNWNVGGLVFGLLMEVIFIIILIVWFVVFAPDAQGFINNSMYPDSYFANNDYVG